MKIKNFILFLFVFCFLSSTFTNTSLAKQTDTEQLVTQLRDGLQTDTTIFHPYIGASYGTVQGKIGTGGIDDKMASSFSFGSSFDIPLFPIRLELEYDNYKMSRTATTNSVSAKAFGLTGSIHRYITKRYAGKIHK